MAEIYSYCFPFFDALLLLVIILVNEVNSNGFYSNHHPPFTIFAKNKFSIKIPDYCPLPNQSNSKGSNSYAAEIKNGKKRNVRQMGERFIKRDLTYRIDNINNTIGRLTLSDMRSNVEKALRLWANVTPLTFKEVIYGTADISFGFYSGVHKDNCTFEDDTTNEGRIIRETAHTTTCCNKNMVCDDHEQEVHFNANMQFIHMPGKRRTNTYSRKGFEIFSTTVHESGHALGLGHSITIGSVMNPVRSKFIWELHRADITAIQALYGTRENNRQRLIKSNFRALQILSLSQTQV